MSHGWLPRNPAAPAVVAGVHFEASLPTRREEYNLLFDSLRDVEPGLALDAGTGYIPEWHVAPYILGEMGWDVLALDFDVRHLSMPPHPNIVRRMGDLSKLPRAALYDLVICISVLEHCSAEEREAFARDVADLTQPGALLLVTADEYEPPLLAGLFAPHFDCGHFHDLAPGEQHLSPRVAYCLGRRI